LSPRRASAWRSEARVEGSFALGQYRRVGGSLFPNQVVEKALGVRATTRWWETIVKVAQLIED